MSRNKKKSHIKKGLSPGTLVYTGSKETLELKLTCIIYDKDEFREYKNFSLDKLKGADTSGKVVWINLQGLHQPQIIEELGKQFAIHNLVLEDIMNVFQRPKLEDYNDYLFLVVKSLNLNKTEHQVSYDQFSLILGKNFVISFQDVNEDDLIEPIKDRIRKDTGRIRKAGADYLLYRLLDQIIDNYFETLEDVGERIEDVEDELITAPSQQSSQNINILKKEILNLRRAVWPLREVISRLERNEFSFIEKSTNIYLRDLYDHLTQIMDIVENDRELISGLLDIYLSSLSNKMNEIIKVLTIISTIFIPLTFIVGLYGMNFNTSKSPYNMPELDSYFGYPAILLLMLIISLLLIFFFRKKKWM